MLLYIYIINSKTDQTVNIQDVDYFAPHRFERIKIP